MPTLGNARGGVSFDFERYLDFENVVFCGIQYAVDPRFKLESTNSRLQIRQVFPTI
jgi:hypothetical protein